MRLATTLAVCLGFGAMPIQAAQQDTNSFSPEFFVWEHHHRCDYQVRPFTDPNGRVEQRIWTYKHEATGITLQVEADGRHLRATDIHGHVLWRRNPHDGLPPYRAEPACIFSMGPKAYAYELVPEVLLSQTRQRPAAQRDVRKGLYVFLNFDNSQFGAIDVRTGDFIFGGQN